MNEANGSTPGPRGRSNQRALAVLPGGYGRYAFDVGRSAPHAASGHGPYIVDESGSTLIDLNNNFTSLIHGNAHPGVTAAAKRAVSEGASFGIPNLAEVELAELLVNRVPWAEQVRFGNSGTEAIMSAIRLARAYTGRNKVIVQRPSYHGMAEVVLGAVDDKHLKGVPGGVSRDVILVQTGDIEDMRRAIDENKHDLAAVLLDLMPTRAGLTPMRGDFVSDTQKLTRSAGALLIIDEVIAFRAAVAGLALSHYGLEPDLLVLGKIIGGGFPVGAILGRRDLMALLDPANPGAIDHGGTFTGNPVTMRAGVAAMNAFDSLAADRLNALGGRLQENLRHGLHGSDWGFTGFGSLARVFPLEASHANWPRDLWWSAYELGVLVMPKTAVLCLSTAMTDELVDEASTKLLQAVAAVRLTNVASV